MTEEQEDARALLDSVHHLMSGNEIAACEKVLSDAWIFTGVSDDWESVDEYLIAGSQKNAFDLLCISFSKEISEWKKTH